MDELIKELNSMKINCNKSKSNSDQNESTIKSIETYAKTVLSVTWTHETRITNDSFKSETSEQDLQTIIYLLDGIKDLCHELNDVKTSNDKNDYDCVKSLLGIDFVECLLWRKGALLYAYCNCKLNDDKDLLNDQEIVAGNDELADEEARHKMLTHLIDGIQWFRLFLSQRQSMDDLLTDEKVSSTQSLIANKIFSDNHLLSMMYLSEMCYWYEKYSNKWQLYVHTDFDVREYAKRYLTIYVNAVENCFKSFGWNCDKAKQLLTLI